MYLSDYFVQLIQNAENNAEQSNEQSDQASETLNTYILFFTMLLCEDDNSIKQYITNELIDDITPNKQYVAAVLKIQNNITSYDGNIGIDDIRLASYMGLYSSLEGINTHYISNKIFVETTQEGQAVDLVYNLLNSKYNQNEVFMLLENNLNIVNYNLLNNKNINKLVLGTSITDFISLIPTGLKHIDIKNPPKTNIITSKSYMKYDNSINKCIASKVPCSESNSCCSQCESDVCTKDETQTCNSCAADNGLDSNNLYTMNTSDNGNNSQIASAKKSNSSNGNKWLLWIIFIVIFFILLFFLM